MAQVLQRKTVHIPSLYSSQLHGEDVVITPILKTSKLRPREVKRLPQIIQLEVSWVGLIPLVYFQGSGGTIGFENGYISRLVFYWF